MVFKQVICLKMVMLAVLSLFLVACSSDSEPKVLGRWYSQTQVDKGNLLFAANCAQCHGGSAQGTSNWNKPLANGKYPPPPLNGQAHAWHHPLIGLKRTIQKGGVALGGTMPGFENRLSEADQDAVIAYFQSLWPDQTYQAWVKRGGLK
ncbi:MAG: c-type cytochrome [Pontibacterium sp.]